MLAISLLFTKILPPFSTFTTCPVFGVHYCPVNLNVLGGANLGEYMEDIFISQHDADATYW